MLQSLHGLVLYSPVFHNDWHFSELRLSTLKYKNSRSVTLMHCRENHHRSSWEKLHQRRNELIAQLTKTKTPDGITGVVNGTRESARSPGTYPPVAQVMPRPSSNTMQNPSRCPTSLANSVADSMATTLTTMSIAKATKEDLTGKEK